MKRTALALTFILLLLAEILTLANSLQASVSSYPSEPVTDPPIIIVHSPSNTTYYENDILVNFTVNQPDSWHQGNLTLVTIKQISYQLDDPVPGHVGFMNSTNNQFSAMLMEVPDGNHSLRIDVLTDSIYKLQRENWIFTETYAMNTRLIVNFTVDAGPSPSASPSPLPSPISNHSEPFPTIWVVVAVAGSVAVIYAAIIVHCKKRKRQPEGEGE